MVGQCAFRRSASLLLLGASRKESFRNRNSFDRSAELLRGFVVSKARVRRHRENEVARLEATLAENHLFPVGRGEG
jgi:hypothetical protein